MYLKVLDLCQGLFTLCHYNGLQLGERQRYVRPYTTVKTRLHSFLPLQLGVGKICEALYNCQDAFALVFAHYAT